MKRYELTFSERLNIRAQNDDMLRDAVGWTEDASFVQLELKPRNTISPEVQAMMDKIHRNSVVREMQLRAEFERKLGQVGRVPA